MKWPMVKLGEIAPAKPLKLVGLDENEQVLQVTLDNIESNSGRLIKKNYSKISEAGSSTHWFDSRYVLYSKLRPYLNKVLLPEEQGLGTTELVPMLPDPNRLCRKYLAHYLKSQKFVDWVSMQTAGAKMPRVSMKVFWDHEIPLPPLEEQKRIAAILDKADSIRRKRQQAIKLADEFLRSVFVDMFGDPVTNPKGWEVKSLGSLIESGPTNGLYKPSTEYGSGIRILRIDGFYNGVLSPQEKLKRVNLGQNEIEKYQLKDRSILINRVNSRDYLGKSAFVERLEEVTVFESNMMNFSANEKIINPCFLVHQLQTPYVKNQVLKLAKDAVNQSSINQQDVKSLEVIVPNLELQTEFELVCTRYKDSLTTRKESIFNCEAIFSSLGQRAFSGQL